MAADPDYETLIVGAGFSGIGTAIMLDRAGLGDYLIVEAGSGAGGTWYWNTYPGIAVDIPSFSYQFSFEQSPDWSRTYAPGRELRAYAEHCVHKYGLAPRIRFNTAVRQARFDDDGNLWRVDTDGGQLTARYLINASGVLTVPNFPDIDGVDSFGGVIMHTARWDHSQDLTGKRVGIIGTGASAVQVIPEIAGKVKHLSVFQRTPIWCFPKFDVPLPKPVRLAMRIPGGRAVQRLLSQAFVEVTFPLAANYFTLNPLADRMPKIGKAFLRKQVHDPQVRDKLTPRYAVGCKRPSFHNSYLSTFNRDNVELVTEPIEKITGSGVATGHVNGAGRHHDVDVLILATGFKVMDADSSPTFPVIRSDGMTLRQFWEDNRLQAYEGVSIPGFPNLFTVFGPYGYVGSSYFALIEAQTHHIVRCLTAARRKAATRIEVRQEANDRFFAGMLHKRRRQIFWQDTCHLANSYYFDKNGDVPLRPSSTVEAYWHSRRFPLADYQFSDR
jgi:cyclohexanone monooxygenase